jgi:NTP pyrophosphatase (non-canonical NTP hydrolase)
MSNDHFTSEEVDEMLADVYGPRTTIYNADQEERARQEDKWGVQRHSWPIWIAVLTEEIGEVSEAALHLHFGGVKTLEDLRVELVQSIAVAVAIVEHIDELTAAEAQ